MAAPTVTINSQSLSIAGFCGTRDIVGLEAPAPMRDVDDFESDGVDGAIFIPKPMGSLRTACSFLVKGANDASGTPHSDPHVGLRNNIETITAAIMSPSALVTCTVTYGDASTRSGQIYVPRVVPSALTDDDSTGAARILVVEIVCPAGGLSA